jgi:carbon monoxide dehydrogenase subunit G
MLQSKREHPNQWTYAVTGVGLVLLLASSVFLMSPALAEHADRNDAAEETKADCAEAKKNPELSACVRIKAPLQAVWEAIHEERESAPGLAYSKIIEHENNHYRLEQKYTLIPFISSITRTLDIQETPNERIDYEVIATGHEKPLKGSWTLKSEDAEDKTTMLALSAQSQRIEKNLIAKELATFWIKRRLDHVKEFAERSNKLSLVGRVLPKKDK